MVITWVRRFPHVWILLFLAVLPPALVLADTKAVSDAVVSELVNKNDRQRLKALGPGVLPVLARQYQTSDPNRRAAIAEIFYELGWKSPEAKRVLMDDVHTTDQNLRLQVQWALGRVSSDDDVVMTLLDNMQNDGNPLFRDKAACALASDQIHLTERQKLRLYQGLIHALRDPKPQVRDIAMKALEIQTGQTKKFDPYASEAARETKVREWERWLDEFKSNL